MLRIGQFSDTFLPVVDGVGRVVQAYAETLSAMGHQVTVVAPMYDTGFQGGFPFELVDFIGSSVPGMKQYKVGEAMLDAHYRTRYRACAQPLYCGIRGAAPGRGAQAAAGGYVPFKIL